MSDEMAPSKAPTQKSDAAKSRKQSLIENATSLALALFLVFMVRSSVIEAFKIPSGSMIPTLFIGDHIFVNKFAYGLKVPFSDWIMDDAIWIYKRDQPKRGDIIVFKFPRDESLYYIKRVIGVPGDTIEMRDKELFVNNNQIPRQRMSEEKRKEILDELDGESYDRANLELFKENIGVSTEDESHTIMVHRGNFISDNYGPIVVPKGRFFVMGDNRNYSNDSRFWGFVPERNIKGRAIVIWLSLWANFSEGKFSFKPSRIGTILH